MAKKKSKTKTDRPDFEQALQKLETIAGELEEGDIGLSEALDRYEEGVGLLGQCHDLLRRADYVLVMEQSHYRAVVSLMPEAAGRTALLAADEEIKDPLGMGLEQYHHCSERISEGIRRWLEQVC